MRLGGFVIHGDNADTLEACLSSLTAVCDEVVAVDSGSADGSRALVETAGVRIVDHPWEGYGAARAAAKEALTGCDYVMYLDSDERLDAGAPEAFARWREAGPTLPHYRLRRQDWVHLPDHDFVFRTEWRTRVVRHELGTWSRDQIVHEALPSRPDAELPATIEHRFVTGLDTREEKLRRYALLWAVQHGATGHRIKSGRVAFYSHMVRNLLFKGAFFRGGADAIAVSRIVSAHHEWKYRYLAAVRAGAFASLTGHYAEGRLRELFAEVGGLSLGGDDGGVAASGRALTSD